MTDSFDLSFHGTWRHRWGHLAPQLLSAAILVAIVIGFRPYAASPVSLLVALVLVGFVLVTWVAMRTHDRRLCEACASAIPLNPQQEAARFRRRFFLSHQGLNPYFLIPYVLVLIGSNFLTSTAGRYVWAAVQASMIYLILSNNTHRKLQPWCPWCSGGGGGGVDEKEPEPDGPRGNTRQLI